MHRDHRVQLEGYADEDPAAVAAELDMAAGLLVRVWRRLDAGQLDRTLVYNYPEPAERTLLWLGRHTTHEVVHHLADVERALGAASAAGSA